MFWTQSGSKFLNDITRNEFTKRFAGYHVISCQADQEQFEAARVTFSRKWNLTLSEQPWPLFCILGDDGRTVVVKDTQDFLRDGKVDDLLVLAFLKENLGRQSGSDAGKPRADEPARQSSTAEATK